MTADIEVRGTDDPAEIAAVVALLSRQGVPPAAPTGVTAWQLTRRAALAASTLSARTRRQRSPGGSRV